METATASNILGGDESTAGSSSSTSTTTASPNKNNMPQILNRAALPGLIGSLDASDVLEAYAVTRTAPLHWNNNTLFVKKSAVAIRYPPPSGSNKPPLELTLEYGPQRMGTLLNQEAMPIVQDDGFITWENEGKIYYTTSFETDEWTKANYMASMTGAVFELLLQKSLDFSSKHPRYQPLRVVTDEGHRPLLKSSASHDFVYSVWEGLASAGVELQPILEPPTHVLQIHVTDIQKVSGVDEDGRVVALEAFEFYQKLYQCATAIQTGNYQSWEPTASPTLSVSPTLSPSSTNTPTTTTVVPTTTKKNKKNKKNKPAAEVTDTPTSAPSVNYKKKKSGNKTDSPAPTMGDEEEEEEENHNDKRKLGDDDEEEQVTEKEKEQNEDKNTNEEEQYEEEEENNNEEEGDEIEDNIEDSTIPPSVAPVMDNSTSPAPTEVSGSEADKAKEAAQEAKEAAQEAKDAAQTPQDNKAADAASKAANAAQAAADATVEAASKAAMEEFRSGDGDLVTTVLRECFEDPKYGIAMQTDNETTTTQTYAYLYLDGSYYYRVNLTYPYMDVARVNLPLPKPPSTDSGNVDLVDWILALFLVSLLVITVLALLQQIGFKIAFAPLQKWFFSPRHYNYEDAKHDSSGMGASLDKQQGQGFNHMFPEDVIPLSMGGRRPTTTTIIKQQNHATIGQHDENGLNRGELGDLEMVPPPLRASPRGSPKSPDSSSSSSLQQVVVVDLMEQMNRIQDEDRADMPRRLSRDPDLVDLPNLKSTTKVAVPVCSSSTNSSMHG